MARTLIIVVVALHIKSGLHKNYKVCTNVASGCYGLWTWSRNICVMMSGKIVRQNHAATMSNAT
jgi:hypothetical protein